MHYSVQPSEIMGFFNMLTANDRQQERWKETIPELEVMGFEELITFISQNNILNVDFFKQIDPSNYSLRDFTQLFPEKHKKMLETTYTAYHSFYEKSAVKEYTEKIEQEINAVGQDSFEKMAQFYGLKGDHSTIAYTVPSVDGSGSCSLSGQEKSFQLLTLKMPIDENTNIKKDVSKLFHETAHGVLEDSGSEKILKDYFKQHNPVTDLVEKYPELKRHKTDSAQIMVDEFLTTAFQKIFARENLRIESSYAQPTIAMMASKMVGTHDKPGILAIALKNGHIFSLEFMKKLEKEFQSAIPEIKKEISSKQHKSSLMTILSEASKNENRIPPNIYHAKLAQNHQAGE